MQEIYSSAQAQNSSFEVSKVLRNTYMLLGMTLAFSALTCGLSMAMGLGRGVSLIMSLGALALVWFVLPRTANSSAGIYVVFGFTGLLGASLGPIINHYMAVSGGSQIIFQALGTTALVFFGLSAYVLTTKKDFSFMGGFLMTGLIVAIVAMLALFVAGFFGVHIPGAQLAISAVVALLMSGFILFDTSRIVNGGERNYIMATTALYLDIYNLFSSLLHIFGIMGDD
ncbi:MAG: Bax inhibitor-1/YccA family protein [Cellvibrionaceae bacterium]|uniref:Bax inhibitor-1/YccA family protein n=1 Tax=uncultured Pseudoteredinibacter sp. TaxID=1641701 RepID=UPI00260E09DF|nr:Bax inhibitor-1/YccA family protein [uncultured Pseudoteredinibacter sp.]MCV6621054.1 Bax inhibitor-1/YccA family protein [Cellvibrionaceae bacterium]